MDTIVLCYHAVSPTWTASLSITPDALERQLAWLTRRHWQATTFSAALLAPSAKRTLAITFDDAFASVLELAYPILASLGLPATVFAPTAFPSGDGVLRWPGIEHWAQTPSAPELRCLTWDALGQLAQDGWEVGSHTRTHPRLTSQPGEQLHAELARSRAEIRDRLGSDCTSVAYPYGDVDNRVAEAARAAGYTAGASLSRRLSRRGALRWPRIGIYHADTFGRFMLKTDRAMRRLSSSRVWPDG